ncbi:MAG: hypothetical protein ACRC2J_19835 [Microcoleaceae cyanobacterium]
MASSLILDEILQELERDASIARIKKVMYCACKGKWENDQSQIDQTNLRELVIELYDAHKSLQTLDELLSRIVSKINKKTEYGIVARKILMNLGRLYEEDDVTSLESGTGLLEAKAEEDQSAKIDTVDNTFSQYRDPGYLFDTRQKIIQSVNPLKTKILIFSALERQFNYSDRDFLTLQSHSLDSLLRKLFHIYENITDLEAKLYSTANEQEDPDENAQIASVIIESFTNAYKQAAGTYSAPPPLSAPAPFLADVDDNYPDIDEVQPTTSSHARRTDTVKIDHQKPEDDVFELGEITNLAQEQVSFNDDDQNKWGNIDDLSPGIRKNAGNIQAVGTAYHSTWVDDHEDATVAMPIAGSAPSPSKQPITEPIQSLDNQSVKTPSQSSSTHLIKAIKHKFNLSEALKELVDNSVEQVMNVVERQFMDLEDSLNGLLIHQNEEERLNLKYQALGDLIKNVQDISSKYLDILYQLESEERKGMQITEANPENISNYHSNPQNQALELAQQGNPKAIASLLNIFLNAQGVNTVIGVKEGCLHIILESQTVPNQQLLAPVVAKEYKSWQISHWPKVRLHGRQAGSKSVTWSWSLE